MEENEIKTVKTTKGILRYYQDWDKWEGGIRMLNPKTVDLYQKTKRIQPESSEYAVFFAFDMKQYDEGKKKLLDLGLITEKDKLLSVKDVPGMFGTQQGLEAYFDFYENRDKIIPEQCDPQEVYFCEFNNYESSINYDGDTEAIKIIIDIWGVDVARTIKRFNVHESIDDIIRQPIKVAGLYFTYHGEKKQPSSVWFGIDNGRGSKVGECFTMYDCALHPVMTSNGEQLIRPELKDLCASYDGKKLYHFYRE